MLIGYARISTDDQKLDLQRDALVKAGVEPERIYEDTASGTKANREALQGLLNTLRQGDTLVVWRLDRLARSMGDLLDIMKKIEAVGAGLRSLNEYIDTTTAMGRMVFHVVGAFAQFERDLIVERTKAGLKAAAARGRKGGNRPISQKKQDIIKGLLLSGKNVAEVAKYADVSKATVYRYFPLGRVLPDEATELQQQTDEALAREKQDAEGAERRRTSARASSRGGKRAV